MEIIFHSFYIRMKASSDKRRGATHLEQLVSRHPKIGDDTPLTLEVLSLHSKIELDDLVSIYNRATTTKPYPLIGKNELTAMAEELENAVNPLDTLASVAETLEHEVKNGNIKVMPDKEVLNFIENAPKKNSNVVLPGKKEGIKYKVKGFSTKKKTMLEGLELAQSDELPVDKPKLVRQVGVYKQPEEKKEERREFDEAALIKVYEYVNRIERYNLGQIKTIPAPKKISSKYIKTTSR